MADYIPMDQVIQLTQEAMRGEGPHNDEPEHVTELRAKLSEDIRKIKMEYGGVVDVPPELV